MAQERTVVFAQGTDRRLTEGFTQIPNVILRLPHVSRNAKTTYACLLSYAWQDGTCHPSQAMLARDAGCSVDSIQRDLDELERANLIKVRRQGLQRPNVYEFPLMLPEAFPDAAPERYQETAPERYPETASVRSQEAADLRRVQDPRDKDSTVVVKAVALGTPAADDDESPSRPNADPEASELQEAVRAVAPSAVPDLEQARAFIFAHRGLASATSAVKAIAERHRRTKKADPILSWQFFLAAAERHAPAQPLASRSVPCPACAGRGSLFDQIRGLVPCAACQGAGTIPPARTSDLEQVAGDAAPV